MKIYKNIELVLTEEETYNIAKSWILTNKEASKKILDGNMLGCPFPNECKRFPCDKKHCNADVCSNGFAYRMS
jgi:hypothetical protein